MKMTTEEAFVKVLQMHGIEHAFGIIGSAFMPISDLFPKAGITFWDVAHETNGGLMCDGYTRTTGKIAMAIAQNGPGITNFVTAVKTAYWNSPPSTEIALSADIGRRLAEVATSRLVAPRPRTGSYQDGSTSTSWNKHRSGSTKTRRLCARVVRRSNIHSAR